VRLAAAGDDRAEVELLRERQRPLDLALGARLHHHRLLARDDRPQRVERGVVGGARHPARGARVGVLLVAVVLRVEERLAERREDAEERVGVAARARGDEADVLGDRRLDDHRRRVAAEGDEGAAPLEDAGARRGEGRGEAGRVGIGEGVRVDAELGDDVGLGLDAGGVRHEPRGRGARPPRGRGLCGERRQRVAAPRAAARRLAGAPGGGEAERAVRVDEAGYTVSPVPSTTRASAGTATRAPTAATRPSRTTTVPLSIVGPETGTMRALVIAYADGTARWPAGWATAGAEATTVPAAAVTRARRENDAMKELAGMRRWRRTARGGLRQAGQERWAERGQPCALRLRAAPCALRPNESRVASRESRVAPALSSPLPAS
jgi:hypothetical protein